TTGNTRTQRPGRIMRPGLGLSCGRSGVFRPSPPGGSPARAWLGIVRGTGHGISAAAGGETPHTGHRALSDDAMDISAGTGPIAQTALWGVIPGVDAIRNFRALAP